MNFDCFLPIFKLKIPSSTIRTREIMKNCVSYELNVLKIKKSYNSLLNWVHNIQLLCSFAPCLPWSSQRPAEACLKICSFLQVFSRNQSF